LKATYKAVVKEEPGYWIGWIEEVPGVNCQEPTREELIGSLRVTLREALAANRTDALDAAGDVFEEVDIAV
jgi:predicted RNase H-like HicB family nuclease